MSKASIFDAVPEDDRLDLTGLTDKPKPAKPRPDKAEVRQDAEALGFTDRTGGKGRAVAAGDSAPSAPPSLTTPPREPVEAASQPPARRILRSGRTVPINLKATADFQARFLAACDQLSEMTGRGMTQAEGFEMAVAALEREIANRN